ncbi:MAG: MBL fold metallo-hydrolase [Candidatus Omnitrophica bacterium]|jgi:7,8-dihydropterin-6-yl-methyl-4-(beta-D-ribofuranosyl)aminobenzene 5'-phosphate synthase|nr:MBL fold metallo-hydrolase [Candidatus Omnitrophota bacterium]
MKLKILFDKERIDDRFESGWGLSYLLEDTLFDTGEKFDYLLKNIQAFGVSLDTIKKLVISHNHWNHRTGLTELLKLRNDLKIYGCSDFFQEFKDRINSSNFIEITNFSQISKDIYTTGPFKTLYKASPILEQSLIVRTKEGISIICACAHMSLIELINRAKFLFANQKINFLIGGFHFIDTDNRLIEYIVKEVKNMGIENIAPSHCSGYEATRLFKGLYGKNFIEIKAGMVLEL